MYLDYYRYVSMGGKVAVDAFPRLEYLAEKKIDRYTQGRVKSMAEIPEAVKQCMAEIVDALGNADPAETASTPALSGFSNDGYSESYGEPVTAERLEKSLYRLICDYLATETDDNGTPLLWAGVSG